MKVLTVFGTRPEAIKMCPLVLELKRHKEIVCKVCLTGQHKEMLQQVMKIFKINADYDFEIMRPNQSLSLITTSVLEKMDQILETERPDLILVHGDTTTSFAAALSAFYHHIQIGHVEAGLRTYDVRSPYPEEFNRQAVDLITDFYFAPTDLAKRQLLSEGKDSEKIFVTGNTVIDALKITINKDYINNDIKWIGNDRMILLTAHRRENIGMPMVNIFCAVSRIVKDYPDVKVIYPIHKNPKVREIAERYLGNNDRIRMIEPLDVYDFHNYIKNSYFIMTDSGGIQEEAPSLGKPVLVMRDTTERPEGVKAGTLQLVGTEEADIYRAAQRLLENSEEYHMMSMASNPYGDGHASEKIVDIIIKNVHGRTDHA